MCIRDSQKKGVKLLVKDYPEYSARPKKAVKETLSTLYEKKLKGNQISNEQTPVIPLTEKELKNIMMYGEPVYCVGVGCNLWGIISQRNNRVTITFNYGWEWLEDVIAKTKGRIYRQKV